MNISQQCLQVLQDMIDDPLIDGESSIACKVTNLKFIINLSKRDTIKPLVFIVGMLVI
jgi:hypothetical protein